jgi:DNA-binding transcriptional LysR family regulator
MAPDKSLRPTDSSCSCVQSAAFSAASSHPDGNNSSSCARLQFLCVLGRKLSRGKSPLKMKEYLGFRHISVETPPSQQPLMDCPLGQAGLQRPAAVHVPYLLAAIRMLETTDLVMTMPTRIAEPVLTLLNLPRLKAPQEIPAIRYSMLWHPRFDSDLLHVWLRETVRQIFRPPPHS